MPSVTNKWSEDPASPRRKNGFAIGDRKLTVRSVFECIRFALLWDLKRYRELFMAYSGACWDLKHLLAAVVTSSVCRARFSRSSMRRGAQHQCLGITGLVDFDQVAIQYDKDMHTASQIGLGNAEPSRARP